MQETETFEQWLRERIVRLSAQAADLAERAEKLQGEAHHMTRDLIAVQGALLYLAVWCGALAAGTDMQFRTNGWYITACIWGGAVVSAILPEGKKKKRRSSI